VVAVADPTDALTGPGLGPRAEPPGPAPGRWPLVAVAVGLGCLGLAVLLWPGSSLGQRADQARAATTAAEANAGALASQVAAARAATAASVQAAEAARDEAERLEQQRRDLLDAEQAAGQAEDAALVGLQAVIASADAVVRAQNDAVALANRGDAAGERAVLRSQAVPAVDRLQADVAAMAPLLEPLRAAVAELAGQLP